MQLGRAFLFTLAIAALPGAAAAHGGGETSSAGSLLLTGWSPDLATGLPIAIATVWYALGVRRIVLEGKHGAISSRQAIAFALGIVVLLVALESPVDAISADLFSVHMVQHLLLMLAAPPLLVWSDCPLIFLRAFPRRTRKMIARVWIRWRLRRAYELLMHPLIVWTLFCGAFVFWHAPGPYQWALDRNWIHILEHLSFFVTSLAFWSIALPPIGHPRRLQAGSTLLFVVSTAVLSGLPGALMIFAPRPLYPGHADGVMKWGLTLLEDQQLAGLIMWIPAGAAYVLAIALIFLAWLGEAEARALRAARRAAPVLLLMPAAALLLAGCDGQDDSSLTNFGGDARRGVVLVNQFGCGHCHDIPKVAGANGNVGPPLQHVGTRAYLAGFVRNSPDNMALWIEDPQKVLPGNAMPTMGMSRRDSRDIAAFLYTLK